MPTLPRAKTLKKIFVTGGAGYVGSVLVPKLLEAGYEVVVFDILFYGNSVLPTDPKLSVVRGDIRDDSAVRKALKGCDGVLHLACISNDPSFELDPALGKTINFDCFEPLVKAAKDAGVKRFVYASSSSVYGVSEAADVDETHPLKPLTDYSKFKALCEPILLKYQSADFTTTIIRPATVCGYGPRMRLDLSVNILTNLAVNNRKITVFGGSQKRPNIHIEDMAELYVTLLELPQASIAGKTYNAGTQNLTIADIAQLVKRVVEQEMPEKAPIEIVTSSTDDLRSYHVGSKLIAAELGFVPKRTVEDAVRGLCKAFKDGKLPDSLNDPKYFNVKTMKGQPAPAA
jgi:nucleoside-diphosphate-sugar epimerase